MIRPRQRGFFIRVNEAGWHPLKKRALARSSLVVVRQGFFCLLISRKKIMKENEQFVVEGIPQVIKDQGLLWWGNY